MVTGANTTDYVLDGTMAVQELRNGTAAATYLTGLRGPEYRRDDAAGTVRWYVYDGLGSVVGEVAPDGSLTCTRKLDAYGCVRSSTGTATSKHKFVGSLGHPSDDETGLIYMRARHYDPVCGRFISEDPAGQGDNWFAYCFDSPTNYVDGTGASGQPTTTLSGGWGIRIDGSPGEAVADMHIRKNGKEIGSIFNSGTWHFILADGLSQSEARSLCEALRASNRKRVQGWSKVLGRAGFTGACISSLDAYLQQDPLGFASIMLDCAGDDRDAAQLDRINGTL